MSNLNSTPLKPPCCNSSDFILSGFATLRDCTRTSMHKWYTAAVYANKVTSMTSYDLKELAENWAATMMDMPFEERENWLEHAIELDLASRPVSES